MLMFVHNLARDDPGGFKRRIPRTRSANAERARVLSVAPKGVVPDTLDLGGR